MLPTVKLILNKRVKDVNKRIRRESLIAIKKYSDLARFSLCFMPVLFLLLSLTKQESRKNHKATFTL